MVLRQIALYNQCLRSKLLGYLVHFWEVAAHERHSSTVVQIPKGEAATDSGRSACDEHDFLEEVALHALAAGLKLGLGPRLADVKRCCLGLLGSLIALLDRLRVIVEIVAWSCFFYHDASRLLLQLINY